MGFFSSYILFFCNLQNQEMATDFSIQQLWTAKSNILQTKQKAGGTTAINN